jgi:hypothetical protein
VHLADLLFWLHQQNTPCDLFSFTTFLARSLHLQKKIPKDVHDRYRVIVDSKSLGINGDKYYGYEDNLYDTVISNPKKFGITCEEQSIVQVKGLIHNTMKIDQSVAFAHIDVDWYEPVKTCLIRIFPQLIIGGRIIVDDYHDWGVCSKAVDEYLQLATGELLLNDSAGSLKITSVKN